MSLLKALLQYRTVVFAAVALLAMTAAAEAQKRRDFMTSNEIEVIRDAQDIDERIEMLTRMIDRRFFVLKVPVAGWKDAGKVSETWGDLPEGTRPQLFGDIYQLLQKAVDDIDNLAAHPDSAPVRDKGDKKAKKDPGRFGVAVRSLAAAAERYSTAFRAEIDKTDVEMEKGPLLNSIALCDQIIEASSRLP